MPPPDPQPPRSRPSRTRQALELLRNMGPRYVAFRALWELRRRTGLLARAFPTAPPRQDFITRAAWVADPKLHLLAPDVRQNLPQLPEPDREKLFAEAARILEGEIRLFSATWQDLGTDWDWHTHPETDYHYPSIHWTQIADFSARAGDIKFVWEKARFSWVYTLARAEAHGGPEAGSYVLGQIAHFIRHNPLNRGPQYRCSQEISLRILAWSFALSYWRHHPALTDTLFADAMHHIRWQLHHVRAAIHFSRIAVRNNHAITETAMLALAQRLFPFFPEAAEWSREGKAWLEEEVAYQIYPGGSYLQHSMNYHRVVVQTLTLVLSPAGLGKEAVSETFRQRAGASLRFLRACQDEASGWLPNYGNNDGALFFPLSSTHYRDYRPALHALARALDLPSPYAQPGNAAEEAAWWGLVPSIETAPVPASYVGEGYAILRHGPTLTFLRAAAYRDRPAQADNLHVDLWHAGRNLLRDAGTYKYNTEPATLARFAGSAGHNSLTLGSYDQMLKGPRFIWYYWPQQAELTAGSDGTTVQARVQAFRHLKPGGIFLNRKITVDPIGPAWLIEDEAEDTLGLPLRQHWHPGEGYEAVLEITAEDPDTGQSLEPQEDTGYYSSYYGRKQEAPHLWFETSGRRIRTRIRLKQPLPPPLYPDQALDE